jgi:ribonuclease T2
MVVQFRSLLACAGALILGSSLASAQDSRQNEPGKFDFYLLSLSWSPSFCAAAGERAQGQPQCGGPDSYSFVVAGLWPQYERGFPEYCQVPAPRLDRSVVSSMLDVMPAPRLIFRNWDRHGTCSGLSARAYFDTVRRARAAVKIPPEYLAPDAAVTLSPGEIEQAFVKANPGLSSRAMAISCDRERLREIRICMTKELTFRACEEVERRSCRRDTVVMPPVRTSKSARGDG